ncbi:dihydroorotase, multifunctional complex type [Candidatus Magnetoovum chiemensis]|nr:dihydroorotase, multifunctional complex type [Candidatus Magnetoovum chiemensis]
MDTIIKNGHIISPSQGIDAKGSIYIKDGIIKDIFSLDGESNAKESVQTSDVKIIEAEGLYVFAGFVDMHVHLREPGFEYKETIRTGTLAGVKGGFTTLCCMPNTNPVNDNETVTDFIIKKAQLEGFCDVFPIGAITKKQQGKELAEFGMMSEAGSVAFSDDGKPVMDSFIMRMALEYAKVFNAPVISHAEDANLAGKGVMNESPLSTSLGLQGIPSEAEVILIKRDIELAALTGGRLHIAHVSTKGGVDAIREAKRAGINITAETCPHYFTITEDKVRGYNTNAKVNPPLRTQKDVEAIKEGLNDDTIDVLVTDHAPHHRDDKLCEFDKAAFGISGLETALGLNLKLVEEGVLSLNRVIEKMTVAPSKILNISKGTLINGRSADIVIVDLNKEYTVDAKNFVSMGKNTPFDDWHLKGAAVMTFFKGKKVYDAT